MQVHIARLIDALHKTLWRHGHVQPQDLRHEVNGQGDHVISLTIAARDAVYDAPKRHDGPFVGVTTPGPKK